MKNIIDFHGYKVKNAISEVEIIISLARIRKETVKYIFIVGHGKIKKEIIKLLKEYEIDHYISMGNEGEINVLID